MSNSFPGAPGDGYPRRAVAPGGPGAGGRPGGGGQRAGRTPGGVYGILHVVGGNDRGKAYTLQLVETSIGRGADQDFILADIAVSRRHVIIAIEGDRYRMKDLGSGNGTLVNGVRTETTILNDGDQIEIGNTVLKLEHAPSRAMAGGHMVPQAAADNKTMMAMDAPNLMPPVAAPPAYGAPQPAYGQQPAYAPPQPAYAPPQPSYPPQGIAPPPGYGEPIAPPNPQRPMAQQLPTPLPTGAHAAPSGGGILNTTAKKVAVFGALGLILLLGGALVVKKFVLGGSGDAQKFFDEGKKAYNDRDFSTAKRMFQSALAADPEFPQAQKFLKQVDLDAKALDTLKKAQGLTGQKKYLEAAELLEKIDSSAQVYKDAEDLKKDIGPKAADELVVEAKDLVKDEPDEARKKVEKALALDPENEDALALDKQLAGAGGTAVASKTDKEDRPGKGGKKGGEKMALIPDDPVVRRPPPPSRPTKPAKGGGDDDLAAVTPTKGGTAPSGPLDLMTSPAAGPYRNKDFAGAATALKAAAKGPNAKAGEALASQVSQLAQIYSKAEADKTKNPAAAVTEYQQALALDNKLGKGTHSGYFKSQLKTVAQQAFAQGKYDVAYEASRIGGDAGVQGQLKAKAAQLVAQAEAMKKSNLNGAKNMWRMVVRMVPPGDPSYTKAQQGLASAQPAHTDEDE